MQSFWVKETNVLIATSNLLSDKLVRKMQLARLLTEIYDIAWEESTVKPMSRRFILQYLPKLIKVDKLEVFTYSFKNFDRDENMSFLLSVPELWESMKLPDWVALMKLLSPRPNITIFDPTGCYSDIIFFIKWLNLDNLQLTLSLDDLNTEDKRRICHYCRAKATSLQRKHEDFEDFNGQVWCAADCLVSYRSKLLAQDERLLPTYSDGVSFKNYVNDIWFQYFNGVI